MYNNKITITKVIRFYSTYITAFVKQVRIYTKDKIMGLQIIIIFQLFQYNLFIFITSIPFRNYDSKSFTSL